VLKKRNEANENAFPFQEIDPPYWRYTGAECSLAIDE
jgi:hypothetical protein